MGDVRSPNGRRLDAQTYSLRALPGGSLVPSHHLWRGLEPNVHQFFSVSQFFAKIGKNAFSRILGASRLSQITLNKFDVLVVEQLRFFFHEVLRVVGDGLYGG